MDFSLTTLFVVPADGTLATGTSDTLTEGQIGAFIETGKVLGTTTNVVDTPFQIMQGRTPDDKVRLGSKKSGMIEKKNVMEWYKSSNVEGDDTTIIELTNFSFKCGEFYNLTMRFSSFYLNAAYYDGMTENIFIETRCCECGEEPCAILTDVETQAVLQEIVDKATAKWGDLATFTLSGTTVADLKITITSLPLTEYQIQCALFDPSLLNEMLMFPYLYRGPENSQDYMIESEKCKEDMEVTVVQRATYNMGTPNDVRIMEYHYHSYQHDWKKLSPTNPHYSQFFKSFVDGTDYTFLYLKFKNTSSNETWASYVHTDQMIIVAVPTEASAVLTGLEAIMEAALGPAKEY